MKEDHTLPGKRAYCFLKLWLCASLLLLQTGNIPQLFAQGTACEGKLTEAEDSYFDGDFARVIILVRDCLRLPGLDSALRIKGNAILIRTYLAMEDQPNARKAAEEILRVDPDYKPTIEEETPSFVNLIEEVRKNLTVIKSGPVAISESGGISPWIWIGAAGAAVATTVIIIASGSEKKDPGDDPSPLPEPPGYPNE